MPLCSRGNCRLGGSSADMTLLDHSQKHMVQVDWLTRDVGMRRVFGPLETAMPYRTSEWRKVGRISGAPFCLISSVCHRRAIASAAGGHGASATECAARAGHVRPFDRKGGDDCGVVHYRHAKEAGYCPESEFMSSVLPESVPASIGRFMSDVSTHPRQREGDSASGHSPFGPYSLGG
jgi:hypothetical protein